MVRRSWLPWLALAVLWFGTLPLRPLFDPDEGRYAEIPREMQASGDWVTPRLNDLKYFEKPPLQYWATAALYSAFGASESTSRLWAATLAFLCVPLVFGFVLRIGYAREVAVVAAAALAINPYFLLIGQLNLLDQGFTFFEVAAVFSLVLAQRSTPDVALERRWMLSAWTCLALATLSKGLVALVLAGVTVLLYMIFTRSLALLKRMHLSLGLPLFAAIVIPWFWLVQSRNPEFAQFFFVHEHFARFLTAVHERTEPFWYFPAIAVFAVSPILGSVRYWKRAGMAGQRTAQEFQVEKFLLIWCAVVLVFFSLSQSKLTPYILPMMPPLAVLLARGTALDPRAQQRAATVVFATMLLLAIALCVSSLRRQGLIDPHLMAGPAVAVVVSLAALLFVRLRADVRAAAQWVAIAMAAIVGMQGMIMAYALRPPMRSAKVLATLIAPLIDSQHTIYSVGQFRHTLAFYIGHSMKVFAFSRELEFGLAQAGVTPAASDLEQFRRAWSAEENALAVIEPDLYPQLQKSGLEGRLVARDARSIVVSRR